MANFSTSKFLPYSAANLFALVKNVANYPDFVPGILGVKIISSTNTLIIAEVEFGNALYRGSYVCEIETIPFQTIKIRGVKGPFSHLYSEWQFREIVDQNGRIQDGQTQNVETEVSFMISFTVSDSLNNSLLRYVLGSIFDNLNSKIMGAFEARANYIYGNS